MDPPPIPSVWGPPTWRALHHVALGHDRRKGSGSGAGSVPDERYVAFFDALADVLPCDACSRKFRSSLEAARPSLQLALADRRLFEWSVELHSAVTSELKPAESVQPPWTSDRALEALLQPDVGASDVSVWALSFSLFVGFVGAAVIVFAVLGVHRLLRSLVAAVLR